MAVKYTERKKNQSLFDIWSKEELESTNYTLERSNGSDSLENVKEETKMSYNAKNAEEGKGSNLPKDEILVGVITNIEDGKVKDFIPESAVEGWKGDVNSPAINLNLDITVEKGETKTVEKLTQMFTYISENGKTIYSSRSNLGKYNTKYGKLPEVGDQVKVITDEHGYGKIKIE